MAANRYRILYVEEPPGVGGTVTGLYELVRSLDRNRYEPIVLFHWANPYREKFQQLGVKVISLNEQLPWESSNHFRKQLIATLAKIHKRLSRAYEVTEELFTAIRVARLIRREKIDLVHHNDNLRRNRATVLAAQLAGVHQICHARTLAGFSFEKHLAKSVDFFVYMSKAIEAVYVDLGIPKSKGKVIYDGFDTEITKQISHEQIAKLRAEFGATEQHALITNVGRLDVWKGQHYFIRAIADVIKTHPNTKALLVGSYFEEYYAELQCLVRDLDLSEHVIFTGFRSDTLPIMAASDILVHSSSEPEPFGRVIVEGMIVGRPVIATAAGGVLDIVDDQVTGLLVPLKNSERMAEAMKYLLQNNAQAKAMGKNAQEQAEKRFSAQQHIAEIQNVYEKILTS